MELFEVLAMSLNNPTLFEAIAGYLLLYGTHAARPTAANAPLNALYFETDTTNLFQNQAGTWVQIASVGGGGGGAVESVAANAPISVDTPTGDVTISHDASGATPGTYGDDTHVAQITVDAEGHVTDVADVAITSSGTPVLLQTVNANTTAKVTCSTTTPADDTIPQNTEGTEVLTVTITPTSASNRIRLEFNCYVAGGNLEYATAALFKDSTAGALAATVTSINATNQTFQLSFTFEHVPGTTSPVTYKVRVGGNFGTVYVNGISTTRLYGGVSSATLIATEFTP